MRSAPIRRSLLRQGLVLGAERELVLTCGLIAFLVGFGGFTLYSAITGISFWIISVFVLRRMAKADPQMSKIWLRHIKRQDFYSARPTPWKMP